MAKARQVEPKSVKFKTSDDTAGTKSLETEDGPILDVYSEIDEIDQALTSYRKADEKITNIRKKARDQITKLDEERKNIKEAIPELFELHGIDGTYHHEYKGKLYEVRINQVASITILEDLQD